MNEWYVCSITDPIYTGAMKIIMKPGMRLGFGYIYKYICTNGKAMENCTLLRCVSVGI